MNKYFNGKRVALVGESIGGNDLYSAAFTRLGSTIVSLDDNPHVIFLGSKIDHTTERTVTKQYAQCTFVMEDKIRDFFQMTQEEVKTFLNVAAANAGIRNVH